MVSRGVVESVENNKSKVITKVVKCDISIEAGKDDKIFTLLDKLLNEGQVIANKCIQYYWEYWLWQLEFKNVNDRLPNKDEVTCKYGCNSIDTFIYRKIAPITSTSNTANITATLHQVSSKLKTDKFKILSGQISFPSFNNIPVDINKNNIKLINDNGYFVELSLFSNKCVKENDLSNGRLRVKLKTLDNGRKSIILRCLSGEYLVNASKLIYNRHKRKWSINITYTHTLIKENNLNTDNICGVDLGVNVAVAMSCNNSPARKMIMGGEIDTYYKKIEAKRLSMLNQATVCGQGRIGHGRKTRLKPIYPSKTYLDKFRNSVNSAYANQIIKFAISNNCGTIQLEDLSSIKYKIKKNKKLRNWTYGDLKDKIIAQANYSNIEVKLIEPSYTSQRCMECGYISKANRSKSRFQCEKCGYTDHADYNASSNIAMNDISNIIKKQRTEQKQAELNTVKCRGKISGNEL